MAALAGLKVTPFGDNSLAISDGNALYLNYMGYVSQVLKGQEGILFSLSKGIGGNMMGSWGWFLLNPYFALFAFTDVINYMQTFTFVSLLNFCTCGLTMYILLKDTYGHKGSNLIFSTAYALNGFLVANVFQMNFFAVIPVLPIMVLGLRRILKDQNPIVYILSIAYGLLMNFYFGFMLCVASFLFFVVFYIAYRNEMPNKKSVLLKYIFSSLLGGAISSVVWLPAILSLRGGRLDQSIASAITFEENMPFLDMFTKLFTGANSTAELSNGLPNIFVGILPVFLVIVFFMNKKIKRQERIAFAVLLLAYLISFYIGVINIFMHGGTTTNWFNYRDSFVFCFLMLMVAAEEWEHITDEPRENLKRTLIILIIGTLIVFSKRFEFLSGGMVLTDFAVLGLMILAYFMHKKDPEKNPKRIFTMVILLLMCVNLFLNYSFSTKNIMDWSHEEGEYQKIVMPVSAMVEAVQNSDDSFYRMEIGEQRSGSTGNDPMLYGYYGVGHGGSDDRNFVRTALSELGVHRFDMRNSYGRGIPSATDNLLGLKYIISKENLTEEKGYEALINLGDWAIYKNQYALPIAMLVDEGAADVTIDLEDVFDNLNRTWSAMTGTESQIFTEESDVVFSSHNVTDSRELRQEQARIITASRDASISAMASSNESSQGRSDEGLLEGVSESETKTKDNPTRGTFQEKPENTNYIQYTFTASRDGAVYSYNRSGMTESQGSMLPSLNYEGYYHIGDTVTGYLPVYGTLVSEYMLEEVAGRFRVAYADADALAEMSQTILDRPSAIEKVKDSHLRGEFTAEAGQMLMFTIPYDEGWTLTVDGQETEIKQVLGVFMAAEVESGEHLYEMKFLPTGLKAGAFTSGTGILLLIVFCLLEAKKRKKKETRPGSLDSPLSDGDSSESSKEENPDITLDDGIPSDGRSISVYLSNFERQPHSVIIFMLMAAISLLICMKSSYNPFAPFQQETDPSVFEYVGIVMSKGGIMYRDIFDHKGPLLYFLNWLGVVCGGKIWFIEFAFILASMIGCYRSFRLFFENKILSALGASLVLLPLYTFFQYGNTVEEYALPFIIWGIYIFITYFLGHNVSKSIWLCGFFLGCVLLLRPNMIAMWAVFAVAVIVNERKQPQRILRFAAKFISGTLLSLAPAVIYLTANHAFGDCVEQYILFNFQYSGAGIRAKILAISQFFLYGGSLIVLGISILLLLVKFDKKRLCAINLIYFLVNIVSVGISGYTFGHYGIILIPAYLLTAILLIDYLSERFSIKALSVAVIIVAMLITIPWFIFIYYGLPQKHASYDREVAAAISTLIKDNTDPDDKIIVCGNWNIIYLRAERAAASKYSYQLPVAEYDPTIYKEFLRDLEENEPEAIVLDTLEINGPLDYRNLHLIVDYYLSEHEYTVWAEVANIKVLGKHPLNPYAKES